MEGMSIGPLKKTGKLKEDQMVFQVIFFGSPTWVTDTMSTEDFWIIRVGMERIHNCEDYEVEFYIMYRVS